MIFVAAFEKVAAEAKTDRYIVGRVKGKLVRRRVSLQAYKKFFRLKEDSK